MPDSSTAIALSAALTAGIAGSAHCVVMCGGLAGALSMRTGVSSDGQPRILRDVGLYHVGRLGGYTVAGTSFGLLGTTLQSMLDFPMLTVAVRMAAGSLLVLVALRILLGWNALGGIERLGAHFWRSIQPLVRQTASRRSNARNLLLGLLWGWLPCGLVYSMLLFAALSGSAFTGAGIMLAFGLGTLPAMLASSLLASQVSHRIGQRGTRQLIGALLLVFGIWLGSAALTSSSHIHAIHTHEDATHRVFSG